MAKIAIVTINVITFKINYLRKKSISKSNTKW